ncbi:MAG: ABC transporter ATP-binding protein [Candidatus Hydrogenedentota bacterium]|nr:MAG: ABC transporter ATP-binding protein [Candidatus Hydrogenedentota bacterium]
MSRIDPPGAESTRGLAIENLRVVFDTNEGPAVGADGVTLEVRPGEAVALVGESGCGKTVTGLSILRLLPRPPARIEAGRILFEGDDLLKFSSREMRRLRGGKIAMIFQEPSVSLNPVLTIGFQLKETLALHTGLRGAVAEKRAAELLEEVRIPEPRKRLRSYPHELSGGMQQRVMIALALAGEPELLVADEPTTALDVTIQAEILSLLDDLRARRGMGLLLITHDLSIVARRTSRLYVMYAARIVESGPTEDVLASPRHPYTKALLAAAPSRRRRARGLEVIAGTVPPANRYPSGCRFHPRCPRAHERCSHELPVWEKTGERGTACFYPEPLSEERSVEE